MNSATIETAFIKPPGVFLNRNFMLLFFGKVISLLGDQIYAFALSWYILDITKSSLTMSIFLMINALTGAIIAPFGGIIADRVSRKNMMVWLDAIRGVIVIIAAILLYLNLMQIWMLYSSAIVLGICGAFFSPAASAIIPNVVTENQLTQATAMDQFAWSSCCIAGMLISGILYHVIGIGAIFLLNAGSYLISGVMEACLRLPPKLPIVKGKTSISRELEKAIRELGEGFRYVCKNPLIVKLTLMLALFNFIVYPFALIYLPFMFNMILKATPFQFALTLGSAFLGNMMGSFLAQKLLHRYKLRSSIFWGLLTWSLCFFIETGMLFLNFKMHFTVWDFTVVFTILGTTGGLAFIFCIIPINVMFQKITADEYRGRFWGFQSAITAFTMAMGFLIGGFLAQRVWMGILFLATGLALFAIMLWVVNIKQLKE